MRSTSSPSLTTGEIACLQLVAQNLTSKEIALHLGISPHTVDQRVRSALRRLEAPNRRQAARLIQSMPHQRRKVGPASSSPHSGGAGEPPSANDAFGLSDAIRFPFPTSRRPINTMSVTERLIWIVGIAFAALVATAVYLAGLESLARLLKH